MSLAVPRSTRRSCRVRLLRAGDEPALGRFLETRWESSLLMLSDLAAAGLADAPARDRSVFAAAFSGGAISAAAAHDRNGLLLLQAPAEAARLAALVLAASKRPLAGLLGPAPQVAALRRDLDLSSRPGSTQKDLALLTLDLDDLLLPEAFAGRALRVRPARSSELDILANWRVDFAEEVACAREDAALRAQARADVEAWQAERRNLVLERHGRLVAACAVVARHEAAVQLGGVWTPPALRGHAFARCMVAGALARLHDGGVRRAVLFTSQPAAARAYRTVGFRSLGTTYSQVRFETPLQFSLPKPPKSAPSEAVRQAPLAKSRGAA